jgi:hypothetical protein
MPRLMSAVILNSLFFAHRLGAALKSIHRDTERGEKAADSQYGSANALADDLMADTKSEAKIDEQGYAGGKICDTVHALIK